MLQHPKKGLFLGMNSAPYFTPPPHMSHWPWMFPKWIRTCSTHSGMAQPETTAKAAGKTQAETTKEKWRKKSIQVHNFLLLGTNSNGLKAKKASLENAVKFFKQSKKRNIAKMEL